MRKAILGAMVAVLALSPAAVLAGGPNGCPPGLAKKNNGCLPPGQAKKIYGRGDHIEGDYVLVWDPAKYGLDPSGTYYQLGDHVFLVDPKTKEILDLIGAVAAVLD